MRTLLSFIFLLFVYSGLTSGFAQTQDSVSEYNVFSEPIPMPQNNQGQFDSITERYNSPEFNYTEQKTEIEIDNPDVDLSFIGILINGLLTYILPLVLGIVVVIGLYQLYIYLQSNSSKALLRKKNEKLITTEDEIEDIHDIDFEKHIKDAIKNQSYTLAIRWSYLYNLKLMDEKKIIDWKPKKTNKDYYYEIKTGTLRKDFKYLTYIYDYLWFGKFEIEQHEAEQILSKFEDFKLTLVHT